MSVLCLLTTDSRTVGNSTRGHFFKHLKVLCASVRRSSVRASEEAAAAWEATVKRGVQWESKWWHQGVGTSRSQFSHLTGKKKSGKLKRKSRGSMRNKPWISLSIKATAQTGKNMEEAVWGARASYPSPGAATLSYPSPTCWSSLSKSWILSMV